MTIQMWTGAMTRAYDEWEGQHEALTAPFRNLAQAEPGLLGSRVAPAATSFLSTWESRVDALRRAASGHADALVSAMYDLRSADAANAEAVQDLLMWSDRETQPFSYGPTP